MTHIIEFTKHSDSYLVYHFEFECNVNSSIGKYAGNCSLNKFMTLNDWQQIHEALVEPVEYYVQNPLRKPAASVRQIDKTHFELKLTWIDLDVTFYSKLLHSVDFDFVFPFIIHVKVYQQSSVDKFVAAIAKTDTNNTTQPKSPVRKKTSISCKQTVEDVNSVTTISIVATPETLVQKKSASIVRKQTPYECIEKSVSPSISIANKGLNNSFNLKDCCVRLPVLKFDENGCVIQKDIERNKRSYLSMMIDNKKNSGKTTPKRIVEPNDFMCSNSSTPYVSSLDVALRQIETDVCGTFLNQKVIKHSINQPSSTPRTSHSRKTGSTQFNPRIRLLKLPADKTNRFNTSKKSKQSNSSKKTTKLAKGLSVKPKKRLKSKKMSVANESELFEDLKETKKVSKTNTTKKKSTPKLKLVKVEERDLKSITEEELWKSFDEHCDMIGNHFHSYLRQTDTVVRTAGDYNHFDMISLFTTDQFSIMLDILFERFVKIGEFGEICYDTLFLELLIPEWALAIYMQRYSLDRKAAIDQIEAKKSETVNQSYDGYTTLVTIKLDETMNRS